MAFRIRAEIVGTSARITTWAPTLMIIAGRRLRIQLLGDEVLNAPLKPLVAVIEACKDGQPS